MSFLQNPTSFRLREAVAGSVQGRAGPDNQYAISDTMYLFKSNHSSHPDFGHLTLLVFEAVLEVVCVALPGYIVARRGMFDADAQKFLSNLNIQLFTPCLVFTKLASRLNAGKLKELWIIVVIFAVQTLVSLLCATVTSKICGFDLRKRNFVKAMAVFGNSNSLPISLVISLSKTLRGLHWDQIPGDNDGEVAARGILYLLIFQQLGQALRWSWGYNVLLAPKKEEVAIAEEGRYRDDMTDDGEESTKPTTTSDYGSGAHSPNTISTAGSSTTLSHAQESEPFVTPMNGNVVHRGAGNLAGRDSDESLRTAPPAYLRRQSSLNHVTRFPSYRTFNDENEMENSAENKNVLQRSKAATLRAWKEAMLTTGAFFKQQFETLPQGIQTPLRWTGLWIYRFFNAIWQSMNPPLWAMLVAVLVASVPELQHFFFDKGTFINNSVTHAITQSGGVAVPLILVCLGGNLARNTIPQEELAVSSEDKKDERKMLIASLLSRMLLPTIFLAPFLAVFAKFVNVSILDDPIFIIVCFLLTGAPSALQLAQICQLNNVFTGVMSKLLFHSYVIWILPSTLVLVMLALETVEWATATV